MASSNFPEELVIGVTSEHIENGIPSNCKSCAIALAVDARFKDEKDYNGVSVGDDVLSVKTEKSSIRYDPASDDELKKMETFVYEFDEGLEVYPIILKFKKNPI